MRSMVAVWVALVASGSGLAFVARGAGPLPVDLALSRFIQQPAPGGFAGFLLLYASDLVWLLSPLVVLVALVIGFVLLGISVLRAGVLPRWAALLLIAGTLAMLGFNDQNALALLAIPNGIGWVAVGYVLWSGRGEGAREPARLP